jgi:hypothetical protein
MCFSSISYVYLQLDHVGLRFHPPLPGTESRPYRRGSGRFSIERIGIIPVAFCISISSIDSRIDHPSWLGAPYASREENINNENNYTNLHRKMTKNDI